MSSPDPADTGDVVVNTTGVGNGTGYVTLLFAENEGFARSTNLTFGVSETLTHPNQNDGSSTGGQPHNILDISQNGQQITVGKNG